MPLTDSDLKQVEDRLRVRHHEGQLPRNPEPAPESFGAKQLARQEAARVARRDAAKAEEERLQRERADAEERRARQREANRPHRERAQQQLAAVQNDLAKMDAEREKLLLRESQLIEAASQ